MKDLNKLIGIFTKKRNIHICITDLIGALKKYNLHIQNTMHTKTFCDIAKSTERGYNLCQRCKNACNLMCIRKKKHFTGHCAFGLFELCYPVVYNNKTICIIYIGNIVKDTEVTLSKIKSASLITKADAILLENELKNAEFQDNADDELVLIAEILKEAILETVSDSVYNITDCQYAVEMAKNMAKRNYSEPLILKNIAKSVYVNEKYLGRLFKKQTGKSFHEYLTDIRLSNATQLLHTTNKSITEIAMQTGFNSVSYFNKNFIRRKKITPTEYRKKK